MPWFSPMNSPTSGNGKTVRSPAIPPCARPANTASPMTPTSLIYQRKIPSSTTPTNNRPASSRNMSAAPRSTPRPPAPSAWRRCSPTPSPWAICPSPTPRSCRGKVPRRRGYAVSKRLLLLDTFEVHQKRRQGPRRRREHTIPHIQGHGIALQKQAELRHFLPRKAGAVIAVDDAQHLGPRKPFCRAQLCQVRTLGPQAIGPRPIAHAAHPMALRTVFHVKCPALVWLWHGNLGTGHDQPQNCH